YLLSPIPRPLSPIPSEDFRQFLRRHDFKLRIGAVAWLLVLAPSPKLRGVTKSIALHVIISDLDDQLGSQRFPREILARAPAALRTRHTATRPGISVLVFCPAFPWMLGERVLAIRCEELYKLPTNDVAEARAHANVL